MGFIPNCGGDKADPDSRLPLFNFYFHVFSRPKGNIYRRYDCKRQRVEDKETPCGDE